MLERGSAYWLALGAEISTQLQAVADKKPPHEILGVGSRASAQEVNAAFDTWVRRMHPDRLHGAPRDLVEKAKQLFVALTEARNLMRDQRKRQAHEATTAVQSAAERAQEAEVEYTKGKLALGANRLQEAEDHFRAATGLEPQNGLYLAELVWVQFLRTPEPQRVRQLPTLILEMQHAAARSPKSARIAYLVGMLFKAQGNMSAAEQAFNAALGMNPHLHEATSELMLLLTRRRTGTHQQAPPAASVQQGAPHTPIGRIWPWSRKPDPR